MTRNPRKITDPAEAVRRLEAEGVFWNEGLFRKIDGKVRVMVKGEWPPAIVAEETILANCYTFAPGPGDEIEGHEVVKAIQDGYDVEFENAFANGIVSHRDTIAAMLDPLNRLRIKPLVVERSVEELADAMRGYIGPDSHFKSLLDELIAAIKREGREG